jgi:hypothetical protein
MNQGRTPADPAALVGDPVSPPRSSGRGRRRPVSPSCRAAARALGLAVLGLVVPGFGSGVPSLHAQALHAPPPSSLPVELDDLNLILVPVTASGVTLRLRLDSGGISVLFSEALQRLGLPPGATQGSGAALPAFREGAWIPALGEGGEAGAVADPPAPGREGARDALIPVRPNGGEWPGLDGVLGLDWLQGRSWTLDYPGRSLFLRSPGDLPLHGPGERLDLLWGDSGRDPPGEETGDGPGGGAGVPVIRVAVSGESIPAAIHTASGAELTEAAVGVMGDLRATRRSITRVDASLFDEWRSRHPDWTVLEGAEEGTGEPVMEIRELGIASTEIPRLWVLRSSRERVEIGGGGSGPELVRLFLGGDVLREFRLTLDFGEGVAVFEPAGFP